ncbi:venom acid phosphatase Acph-1-like [Trichogramma pretiosum]|uniref:venom acid phosphatase Acph-1-like n=1 Tax=Trichogramma pretiosum TaxID=7493 RepID=UPI0006C9574C|nr:venom acid phosphatase Acph-1-like [Trichogramma pretiosum]
MQSSLLLFVTIAFLQCFGSDAARSHPTLRAVTVIFRHGDRLPNDQKGGGLTNTGRLRSYRFGEKLRKKYGDFLGEFYEPASIFARSTEYARAQMSLQLTLASLYPPQKHQKWHKSLNWQPIPYSHAPLNNDVLLYPDGCPRFVQELKAAESSAEFKKLLEPFQETMKNLTRLTGSQVSSSRDMFLLYHKFDAMRYMNETLEDWVYDYFPDGALLNGTYLEYKRLKFTDWLRKINGGALMRKVVDDMTAESKRAEADGRKLFLYGAHELNIVSVLQTLKLWKPHIPEYSSAVVLELREQLNLHFVKVLHYQGIPPVFIEKQIPGCTTLCPLDKFIKLIEDQLPSYDEIICSNERL